jgi:hypothetical protein
MVSVTAEGSTTMPDELIVVTFCDVVVVVRGTDADPLEEPVLADALPWGAHPASPNAAALATPAAPRAPNFKKLLRERSVSFMIYTPYKWLV